MASYIDRELAPLLLRILFQLNDNYLAYSTGLLKKNKCFYEYNNTEMNTTIQQLTVYIYICSI